MTPEGEKAKYALIGAGVVIAALVATAIFISIATTPLSATSDEALNRDKLSPPPKQPSIQDITVNVRLNHEDAYDDYRANVRTCFDDYIPEPAPIATPIPAEPPKSAVAEFVSTAPPVYIAPNSAPDDKQVHSSSFPALLPGPSQVASIPDFHHTPDFRTVHKGGIRHELSTNESRLVEFYYQAYEKGVPEVHQSAALVELDIQTQRLKDVFKRNKAAYKALFVIGKRKGSFRLNIA